MTLYARLDKSGKRVVCGMTDCGGELALIFAVPAPIDRFRDDVSDNNPRCIWFGPGWDQRSDRVWALTRRGSMKVRRGQLMCNRPGRPTQRDGRGETIGWLPYNLPVAGKCPMCGQVQTLDALRLNVSINPNARASGDDLQISQQSREYRARNYRRRDVFPGTMYAPPELNPNIDYS